MPEIEIVEIEIPKPLPETGVVDTTYRIEGTVKAFAAVGAPPFVYAEVQKKEWWRPEIIEETTYERGFPMPISGEFKIAWKPKKTGIYDVTVIATPAPLSLPIVGLQPIVGKSDIMKITVSEKPEEPAGEFKELEITFYDSVSPPNVLKVNPGDTIRVTTKFDYIGPAVEGKLYSALWHSSWYDPHDEIAHGEKAFSIPDSPPPGNHITVLADIEVPSGFADTDFGLYSKLMGVPGPGVTSPYYENIIEILGVPPKSDIGTLRGFTVPPGTYDIGDTVNYELPFEYKGPEQSGTLIITLGTGVTPSYFPKATVLARDVSFKESIDWTQHDESGSFVLPEGLEPGRTYSAQAILKTADGLASEPGTEYGVITITRMVTLEVSIEPPEAGYVTTEPEPVGGEENYWLFPYETIVRVEAHPNPGYVFDWWSGEMKDTQANPAPTYALKEAHTRIRAKFKKEEEALETLEVRIDPVGAGYVTVSPEPAGGVQHNWQFLHGTTVYVTAHPKTGYVFYWWSGEMTDTPAITAPVYPMTEHRRITAHFKKEEVPPPPPTEPEFKELEIYRYTEKPWQGSTCYVHLTFKYRGPKVTKELYAAIGKIWVGVFDEYLYASKMVEISAADFWQTRLGRVEISIPRDADLSIYDLYAKIDGVIPDIISEYYNDVVEIIL